MARAKRVSPAIICMRPLFRLLDMLLVRLNWEALGDVLRLPVSLLLLPFLILIDAVYTFKMLTNLQKKNEIARARVSDLHTASLVMHLRVLEEGIGGL